jgi:hypothetical protein
VTTQPLVVESDKDADGLLNELVVQSVFERAPVGLDFETTGCDPSKQSPVGNARVWCMTVSWGQPSEVTPSPFKTAFVPREHLERFRYWLENPDWLKVGTNILGYDRHALKNEGMELRGIHACTSAMSRLLDPGKNNGHGLKAWGERLGYRTREYKELSTVPVPGAVKRVSWFCYWCDWYPADGEKVVARKWECPACGFPPNTGKPWPVEAQAVQWVMKELPELWADYPDKRKAIVEYACLDPAMSLDVFHHLKAKLEGVKW